MRVSSTCPVTFAFIDASQDVSSLYTDPERDKKVVAVVEDPLIFWHWSVPANSRVPNHVLGGLISPIDNVGPEKLHIHELIERIDKDSIQRRLFWQATGQTGYFNFAVTDFILKEQSS